MNKPQDFPQLIQEAKALDAVQAQTPVRERSHQRLTKAGIIILLISLILSICFTTVGIILQESKPILMQANITRKVSCSSGDVLRFEFTPKTSGYYFLHTKNAFIQDIDNVIVNHAEQATRNEDYVEVFLYRNQKYTIKLSASSPQVTFVINTYDDMPFK